MMLKIDKIVCAAYLLYQARIPVRYLLTPEDQYGLTETLLTLLLIASIPVLLTLPFLMSRRWGAYFFLLAQVLTLASNRMTGQPFAVAQWVAVVLIVYVLLRLFGFLGEPLSPIKPANRPLDAALTSRSVRTLEGGG